jgi:alcohol dehydrogenase YqhD (iron-dependent ADH family)
MASKYSSIDNSPTKQKYTFSKAERFPKISIYGAMSFYNLPSVKNERATSFGYGS